MAPVVSPHSSSHRVDGGCVVTRASLQKALGPSAGTSRGDRAAGTTPWVCPRAPTSPSFQPLSHPGYSMSTRGTRTGLGLGGAARILDSGIVAQMPSSELPRL